MLTIWIALDDVDVANGAVHYVPGSHSHLIDPTMVINDTNGMTYKLLAPEQVDKLQAVSFDVPAGHAVMHHCLTVHGAPPNKSDRPRRGYTVHLAQAGVMPLDEAQHPMLRGTFQGPVAAKERTISHSARSGKPFVQFTATDKVRLQAGSPQKGRACRYESMHFPELTTQDWVLIVAVTCQATIFAYVHHPVWKAFMLSLPIPFTIAMLAVGHPLDVTNIAGFGLLMIFYPLVRTAYRRWRWPILAAIMLALCAYIMIASFLSAEMPRTKSFFWFASAFVFGAALAQYKLLPRQKEEGYRSPMSVWLKVPAIALVSLCAVLTGGSMYWPRSFPMVTIIAAYEGRFVLNAIGRQMPPVHNDDVPDDAYDYTVHSLGLPEDAAGLDRIPLFHGPDNAAAAKALSRRVWRAVAPRRFDRCRARRFCGGGRDAVD